MDHERGQALTDVELFCVNREHCADRIDDHAREVPAPNTLCGRCIQAATDLTEQLPDQWGQLHAMLGERHAGIDVGIRKPKPSGTVNLNLHVDALLGNILEAVTAAAEVLADKLAMTDSTGHPLDVTRILHRDDNGKLIGSSARPPHAQVATCAGIVAPNIHTLMLIRGVGGRDPLDRAIDVMFWNRAGNLHGVRCTTGTQMIQHLTRLASIAHHTLGQTRARFSRDVACARCGARAVGRWAGSDHFDCTACGARFPEDDIRRQDRILIQRAKLGLLDVEQ